MCAIVATLPTMYPAGFIVGYKMWNLGDKVIAKKEHGIYHGVIKAGEKGEITKVLHNVITVRWNCSHYGNYTKCTTNIEHIYKGRKVIANEHLSSTGNTKLPAGEVGKIRKFDAFIWIDWENFGLWTYSEDQFGKTFRFADDNDETPVKSTDCCANPNPHVPNGIHCWL